MTSIAPPRMPEPAPPGTSPPASAPILRMRGVTRVHGGGVTQVVALRGLDLVVHPGELVAVMGPSGSGKSTLLTLAGGLDLATSGDVFVDGTALGGLSARALAALRRRSLGYVFQDLNLVPALTAAENVALPRELDGVATRTARREAVAALADVGVADLADRFPDQMSGGQQQRVAIARALVGPRRLVLADEPTGALDSATSGEVMRMLRARCDAGAAGLLVTHEARHAGWADRVVFLRDGTVVDSTGEPSTPESLLGSTSTHPHGSRSSDRPPFVPRRTNPGPSSPGPSSPGPSSPGRPSPGRPSPGATDPGRPDGDSGSATDGADR
ncbi:ABC-type antimicrobial peptide transport system, ATPase component [Frankia torreyi]|uniref:ABC-type antimicrobial peptide transport system, ATPase component n=2 Tax=Frankia TaxID=1854 RepID=A0A0D8B5E2_9ACTN|nr:ABC transporter ATP-binding protein [Frankia torreyi]KJE19513.1 ABC-type antimicrobial peptide transport system, ATPase component [Frankia torreyi]